MDSAYAVGPLVSAHRRRVAEIVRATGLFREEEVSVALEVFDDGMRGEYELLGVFRTSAAGRGTEQSGRPTTTDATAHPDAAMLFPTTAAGERAAAESLLLGYAAFGATPHTDRAWDLYWIAVHPEAQGTGAGTMLLNSVERTMRERDARLVAVETSSRTEYDGTRRFYARRGYAEVARMRAFYAPTDDRVIFTKRVAAPVSGHGVAK